MSRLSLVFACGAEAFEPLWDGTVQLDGIDLTFVRQHAIPERHRRMVEEQEFDLCEYSLGNYLTGFPLGLPFTAVPIFPARRFRQSYVWVSRAAGIDAPEQLAGKRIGIAMWSNSALLWHRAFLQHDYGLDLASPEWVSDRPDVPGYKPPAWARIRHAPPGATLEGLLARGTVDAVLLPTPPRWEPGDEAHVRRLFPDYVSVEQDYFRHTGIFPPMHTVVIKHRVLAEHPWVADSVYEGLARMLDVYVERRRAANAPSAVWPDLTWAEQEAVLGPQPWASGLAANRATLPAAIGYAVEQGLIAERMDPEALFQFEGRALAGSAVS
ncbi:MAG TPA: 4,5-dihydroxyphthalate decarboxylase [Chloroflexota bacterium]|nr:4,5-dihydroxyphthalate decarboxylase [Chloroflexota bacterium]